MDRYERRALATQVRDQGIRRGHRLYGFFWQNEPNFPSIIQQDEFREGQISSAARADAKKQRRFS
jgi:hypothetical protein